MVRQGLTAVVFLFTALLAACSSGPVRRVSEPAASIQQLTVRANGSWSVDVRLQNYSSIPMRFERVSLALEVDGQAAGTLEASPTLSIAPESADVITLPFTPSAGAKIVLADALAARRPLPYTIKGTANATPEAGKPRDFQLDGRNVLNPVPGLDGVLR